MTGVQPKGRGSFNLYAFRHDDDPETDLRRTRLPLERVGQAVEWAIDRGSQYVTVQHIADREPFGSLLIHHVCRDPDCPGGCSGHNRSEEPT